VQEQRRSPPVIGTLILSFLTVSAGVTVESRVARAREGDLQAREDLIRDYTPFILKTASSAARRFLVVGRDEEVSVALSAFNEAVSAYTSAKPGYLAFAATVIRRRLIDYYRKEKRRDEIPFSSLSDDEESEEWPVIAGAAKSYEAEDWSRVLERRDDIERWVEVLRGFRLTLKDVIRATPRHADARGRAIRTAARLANDPDLARKFMEQRRLPVDELVRSMPDQVASRKTLERQRDYIAAIAIILMCDLSSLREFLNLGR